jgi:hypothetical protein
MKTGFIYIGILLNIKIFYLDTTKCAGNIDPIYPHFLENVGSQGVKRIIEKFKHKSRILLNELVILN